MSVSQYKRVVIKLSGEALAGDLGFGFSPEVIKSIAAEIKDVIDLGVEVALRRLVILWSGRKGVYRLA